MIIKVDPMSNKLLKRQPPKFAKGHELELNLELGKLMDQGKKQYHLVCMPRWWSLLPSPSFRMDFSTLQVQVPA
jgi:hypothetical protein